MKKLFVVLALAIATIAWCNSDAIAAWPFVANDGVHNSPSIADINGDGALEIVFGSWSGVAYCVDIYGNEIWSKNLYDPAGKFWPPNLRSSPALVNLDADPATLEVVIGSYDDIGGILYCLGADGSEMAIFITDTAVFSPPLVCDLENDGELEIIFGDVRPQNGSPVFLYCTSVQKTEAGIELLERWSVSKLDGSVFGSPAVSDLDNDGILEIFVSLGGTIGTSSPNAALFCLDSNGKEIWNWFDPFGFSFQYHTPAIVDTDADGALDVAVTPFNGEFYCLNANNGSVKWFYNHAGASLLGSPGVAPLSSTNGELDCLFESYAGGSNGDRVYCVDHLGQHRWNHGIAPKWGGQSSPGIADVDGDGDLEVAIGTAGLPSQGPSHMHLFDHNGNVVWSYPVPNVVQSSPALADLDGDGFLEIIFGCGDHKLYVLDHQGKTFVPNPNTKPKDLAPWPTFRQNNQRTGYYPGPPKTPNVPGDITGNGIVDVDDLLTVINEWGACPINKPCAADIAPAEKPNNVVNVDDLVMVINNWTK